MREGGKGKHCATRCKSIIENIDLLQMFHVRRDTSNSMALNR